MMAALGHAARGWAVFPCSPKDKKPLIAKWQENATTDQEQIVAWWKRWPNAMIGIVTGAKSRVWVLDLDKKEHADGLAALERLEAKHGKLPITFEVDTPSGGRHLYFAYVDGIRNRGSFEPGIDVRGEGGYAIAAGSVRDDGCYYELVSDCVIQEASDWLLQIVKKIESPIAVASSSKRNSAYTDAAINNELAKMVGTPSGRNNQLNDTSFAIGQFVPIGAISKSEAEHRLFGAATASGYVDKDGGAAARATIRSGLEAGMRQPREIPVSDIDGLPDPEPEFVLAWVARQLGRSTKQGKPRFSITWFDDVNQTVVKSWLLQGVLGEGEQTVWVAKPGTGKSVLATDIGCHIAADKPWHGRSVKQGLVVYYAAERRQLTERRVAAWAKKHGVRNIPFVVVSGKLDLTGNMLDAKALTDTIRELEQKSGHSCVLIIFDTLTRTFGSGDQHQSKDMTRYVQSVDAVMAETGAHAAIIHHSPWSDDRGKGAIDLDGAVDASFGIKAAGTGATKQFTLECTGANDGEEGVITHFKLESVPLGVDEDGNETTAPVVVPTDAQRVLKNVDLALGSLERAIATHGQHASESQESAVPERDWRQQFYADCLAEKPTMTKEAMTKRFQRASDDLIRNEKVVRYGDLYGPGRPQVTLH